MSSNNNSKGNNYYTRGGKVHKGKGKQFWRSKNANNSPKPYTNEKNSPSPYKAWNLYFPEESTVTNFVLANQIMLIVFSICGRYSYA